MTSFVESLDASKTGILFIEYQNDFCKEGGNLYPALKTVMESNEMLNKSKELLTFARSKGIKVLHAPILFSDDYRELSNTNLYGILANVKGGKSFLKNGWGGKIIDEMIPLDNEIIVQGKTGLCAFASTNLDFLLRQHNIENLIICGFLTNCCVESSMRTAYEKGK